MCGRFTQTKSREEVIEQLGGIELPPQTIAIIRQQSPIRAEECIWGFNNPRSGAPIINARSETLAERTIFKHLLSTNRCLIPADGFYEWKGRQPYYFQTLEKNLFAFAGLWQNGRCVVITRAADQNMQGIHDRMPVILSPNRWNAWLLDFPPLETSPVLTMRSVSRRVNRVANDDPACLEPGEVQTDLSLFPSEE